MRAKFGDLVMHEGKLMLFMGVICEEDARAFPKELFDYAAPWGKCAVLLQLNGLLRHTGDNSYDHFRPI